MADNVNTGQLPDSDGYNLHARLIGGVPAKSEDLFVCIIFGLFFWSACAFGIMRALSKRKKDDVEIQPFRTYVLLAVSVSCFLMGMGFFIRAGLSNTPQAKRKRTTYIAEQVFLVLASLIWVDAPALTLTRDVVYIDVLEDEALAAGKKLEPPIPKKVTHWFSKFTMLARLLTVLAAILYVYGFALLPSPGDAQPPSHKSTNLRLVASLLIFLIIILNIMAFLFHIFIVRFLNKEAIKGRALVLVMNLFIFVTVLYNFVIVAVTDDYSPLLDSKLFFYFAYIFFPILVVAACMLFEINIWTATKEFTYFAF